MKQHRRTMEDNRRLLLEIIHGHKTSYFDQKEIEDEFRVRTGIEVGSESLYSFLKELTELGALDCENYRYIVRIPRSAVAA